MPEAAAVRLVATDDEDRDHFVQLHGLSWSDYLRVLAMRGDRSAPRIAYVEGTLEIMSPSRTHEQKKSVIGRLVEAWCLDRGIEMSAFGSWTLKRRAKKRGVEPDECYVFGAEEKDFPDLAIEVEWTHGGIEKLDIYAPLGIREVWRYSEGRLNVHVLRGKRYVRAARSAALPDLDLALLMEFVDRPTLTRAIRDFRDAVAARGRARKPRRSAT